MISPSFSCPLPSLSTSSSSSSSNSSSSSTNESWKIVCACGYISSANDTARLSLSGTTFFSCPSFSKANQVKKLGDAPLTGFVRSFPSFHFSEALTEVISSSDSGDWMLWNVFVMVNESSSRYSLGSKVKENSTILGSLGSRATLKALRWARS